MLEKTQKQDIHIDRKGSTAKKYISIESCKYSFHVIASICLQKIFKKSKFVELPSNRSWKVSAYPKYSQSCKAEKWCNKWEFKILRFLQDNCLSTCSVNSSIIPLKYSRVLCNMGLQNSNMKPQQLMASVHAQWGNKGFFS